MRRLGANGAPLEVPCAAGAAPSCTPVLAHFANALDDAARAEGTATVVVFGNSLIASDGVTSVVRDRLVRRFGDGGKGYLLADRMAEYGPRDRTAERASGWLVETTADGKPASSPLGLAGVQHLSEGPAYSRFDVTGADAATVFWRDAPRAPRLSWRVDGGAWTRLGGSGKGPQVTRLALPEGARKLELRAAGGGAVVQGVALESRAPGVVLDVFGVPSADAHRWLDANEALFADQLAARAPDLVMVMLGGNEAKRIAWGSATRDTTEEDLRAFLARTKAAAPGASCVVVGPIDSVVGGAAPPGVEPPGEPFRQRPQLATVIDVERRVALESGCGFFDLYAAMGGKGSLERLDGLGLLHEDLVHPRQKGLDVLGQLIADALLDGYAATPVDALDAHSAKPPEPLAARP
ncbi:MAG: GDSL-type esterase/lipase family protein [Myxococcota bacterium]